MCERTYPIRKERELLRQNAAAMVKAEGLDIQNLYLLRCAMAILDEDRESLFEAARWYWWWADQFDR